MKNKSTFAKCLFIGLLCKKTYSVVKAMVFYILKPLSKSCAKIFIFFETITRFSRFFCEMNEKMPKLTIFKLKSCFVVIPKLQKRYKFIHILCFGASGRCFCMINLFAVGR